MEVGAQHHAPTALHTGKRPGAHCIGGWVGHRAGLDGCGKSRLHGVRSPDLPAVASRYTHELSRPRNKSIVYVCRTLCCY